MPVGVVERAHPVDVDRHDRDVLAEERGLPEDLGDLALDAKAVAQPGQHIGTGDRQPLVGGRHEAALRHPSQEVAPQMSTRWNGAAQSDDSGPKITTNR